MESEKVKEIKKCLEMFAIDNKEMTLFQSPVPQGESCVKSIKYADILTLINELESENAYKQEHIELWFRKNEEKKKRIAELEKGNEALSFAVKQGFNDCQTKILKQFAERLKENFEHECSRYGQLCDSECEYIIDETLKEFI